ncbi:MAG: hypothetical protein ACFFE6_09535 [Candidatus Thorarchaeota archaeon]
MAEDEICEITLILHDLSDDRIVCPFSEGRWKKVGDALILFMLVGMPILYLIAILMTI